VNILTTTINIKPEMIDWAIQRARLDDVAQQSSIIKRAFLWIDCKKKPTLPQLTQFAKKVMVPFGYLFLDSPPDEPLPIADFRTFDDKTPPRPSPNLLDTIYEMQARQDWMRENTLADEVGPVGFVGSISKSEAVETAAVQVRNNLGLPTNWNQDCKDTEECFRKLRQTADQQGILVFLNGTVGGNSHRPLDHREFRGFVLSDQFAPLVFINANDTKAAQLFTLTHELVHIALGESGLFNLHNFEAGQNKLEVHCNRIAAEFLVPSDRFQLAWNNHSPGMPISELAKNFRVSRLVIARRALDHKLISRDLFFAFYQKYKDEWEHSRERKKAEGRTGGNFYLTTRSRLSRRFSETVFSAVRAGELLYRDAYDLMGLNGKTFEKYRQFIQEGEDE
jgi:Zn-dependent peptidase ImmA (M78 family)